MKAIHTNDLEFNVCQVYQLDEEDNRFEMVSNPTISYSYDDVMNDKEFIVFTSDNAVLPKI